MRRRNLAVLVSLSLMGTMSIFLQQVQPILLMPLHEFPVSFLTSSNTSNHILTFHFAEIILYPINFPTKFHCYFFLSHIRMLFYYFQHSFIFRTHFFYMQFHLGSILGSVLGSTLGSVLNYLRTTLGSFFLLIFQFTSHFDSSL